MLAEYADRNPITAFVGMFHDPRSRWFLGYVLVAVAIAFVVFLIHRRKDPELREEGFWRFLFPRDVYLHESAQADYWFFIVNKLTFGALLAGFTTLGWVGSQLGYNFLRVFAEPASGGVSPVVATLATTAIVALAVDFGLWYAHYLCHRHPLLWEFHKVHHSAEVLTPLTAGRVHPVDDLLGIATSGLIGGFCYGLCAFLFGADAIMLSVAQIDIVMFLFFICGFHLRHSHVWLPYRGVLGRIFVSPAHHQLHHSIEERHWDKNMGFVFAVWDWLAGTLYVPEKEEKIKFGMNGVEEKEYHSVTAMYALPFVKAWRLIRGVRSKPDTPAIPAE